MFLPTFFWRGGVLGGWWWGGSFVAYSLVSDNFVFFFTDLDY